MAAADLLTGVMIFPILVSEVLLFCGQISFERVCVVQAINKNVMACMQFSSLYPLAAVAWDRKDHTTTALSSTTTAFVYQLEWTFQACVNYAPSNTCKAKYACAVPALA